MFRTELPLTPHPQQLPLSARTLTIGSCFSDSIGARLAADKVTTLVNPFGTVFNPVSACRLLRAAAGEDMDWQQHVVEARGRWQSLDLHATHGAESPVELLQQVQQLLRDTGVFLATADVVVLTLGSAWVYRYKETDELISNCHKLLAEKFEKELLTPDEVINAVAETHAYLRLRNPKLRFVLTVSPVRHAKDTLPLNTVSKSVLRVACHYLSELLPDVSYFPAYELLLDDLRDYRFYAEDMLHPSKVAEDYIWERFARTYFDADFGRFRKEWEAVRQSLTHRPLYPAAPEHRQFLESTLERLERLSGQTDVRMELLEVRRQIQSLPLPAVKPELQPEDDGEERIDIGEYAAAPVRQAVPVLREKAEEEEEEFEQFESVREESSAGEPDATDDDDATAESDTAEVLDELAPKKKRRSRGGAKRNKKKHAARLAAELTTQDDSVVATDGSTLPAVPTQPTPLPTAPAVSVTSDPDMTPQTAMERRKRNSRRGRGRGQQDDLAAMAPEAAEVSPTLNAPAPSQPEHTPTAQTPAANNDATPLAPASTAGTGLATPEAEEAEPGTSQRPVRTGRSASEKRADALRKPHRPASRIKTLYADEATGDTTALPAARQPSIPVTKGTGASGKLSESGRATLSARPQAAAPVVSASPVTAVAELKPTMPAAVTPAVSSVELPQAAPSTKKTASKPRRAPARQLAAEPTAKPKAPTPDTPEALAPENQTTVVPAAKIATAGRAPRKPRVTSVLKETDRATAAVPVAATETVASATVAKARRKPVAPAAKKASAPRKTPAATPAKAPVPSKAQVAKAPAAKRPSRPARSKPAKPDTLPENA